MDTRARAARASVILDDEVFKDAVAKIERTLVGEWKISPDAQSRETCWHKINALYAVLEELKAIVDSEKIENNRK